jgi:peptidyl-tRNA hydrolase, PTH1 family
MIKLIVGLGNPGAEYSATRHNAGFWWVDQLAQTLQLTLVSDKAHYGLLARTQVAVQPLWLLQPQTFMNASGRSVGSVARFFKIEPSQVLVVHDELDLPPGEAKLKFGGSHAGHNGLRDIHAQLGTPDYWRLRLGIGHPGVKSEVIHWVLKKPSLDHRIAIDQCIDRSLAAMPHFLAGAMDKAMQVVHTSTPPRPKPPRLATKEVPS